MRSILTALDTAQKQPSREPYIPITIENRWEAVRRWDFAQLSTAVHTQSKHDVAVAGDGSITRVRIEGGNLKGQRVTDPTNPAPWAAWSDYVTGIGAAVACAAKGTRVAVLYVDAAGTGVKVIESTDSGQTFGAAVAVATAAAAVQDLGVAYKNAGGDLLIGWVTATTLSVRRRDGGAFAAVANHATTQSNLNGLAVAYNGDYAMAVTGDASGTTMGTLWSTGYGDGFEIAMNTFGSWLVQFQSDSSTAVSKYQAPSLCHDGSAYRAAFVDEPFYTGGVTRTYWSYLHPDLAWVIGNFGWRAPLPTNHHLTNGIMLASDGVYVYASATNAVWRAPVSAVTLSAEADLVGLRIDEEQFDGGGFIDFDNASGAYSGPPAPVQIGALVQVSMGYRTASGPQASRLQDFWIEGWEYRRTGGVSVLRTYVESAWRRLRRQRNRTSVHHNPATYKVIVGAILARAGLAVNVNLASTRYNTVSQRFLIDPTEDGYTALRRALAAVTDRIVLRAGGSAAVIEPLSGDATDIDIVAGGYTLNEIRYGLQLPPVSEAHAISQTGTALIAAPDTDYAFAEYGQGELEQVRDASSTTAGAASATAAAHRRQRELDRRTGRLLLRPIVQLELQDVIEFGDSRIYPFDVAQRVYAIRWRYDRRNERFEQEVEVGPL